MKLYLCSYRISHLESLLALAGKPASQISMAIIPNAKDYYAYRARNFKLRQTEDYMSDLGIKSETIDLREFDDAGELADVLNKFDVLWVSGGNTFCLRYEMKRSGFDTIVKQLLENGLVYAGESAGACVAGTTLRGIENADEPEFAEAVHWDGLDLANHYILPHADNPAYKEDTVQIREMFKDDKTFIELNDNQALVIDGENEKVVTGKII